MKAPNHPIPDDDFLAPARRAFRRVARQLRAENVRLGLPLIVGQGGRVKRVNPRANPTKANNQNDATGFIRLNGLRLRVNSRVNGAGNTGKSS
jgi:hypothetical protein